MMKRNHSITLVLFFVAVTGCNDGGNTDNSAETDNTGETDNIAERVKSATVKINVSATSVVPGTAQPLVSKRQVNGGSGYFIDQSGYVLTNYHVVSGADTIEVKVDGVDIPYEASVIGVSECADLAVIKLLSGSGFDSLEWFSGQPEIGFPVAAAGFPGDVIDTADYEREYTYTEGIINTDVRLLDTQWASVEVFNHSAHTSSGSSGGPVVELERGTVVGINYGGSKNRALAISAAAVRNSTELMKSGENVFSIGVGGQVVFSYVNNNGTLVLGLAEQLPEGVIRRPAGIWVSSVRQGSKADETGIRPGDIIREIAGRSLYIDGTEESLEQEYAKFSMGPYCGALRDKNIDIESSLITVSILRPASGSECTGEINGKKLALKDDAGSACPLSKLPKAPSNTDDTDGGQKPDPEKPPASGDDGLNPPANRTPVARDTIAYVSSSLNKKSIRLIQSDGSNDRLLWTVPDNQFISPRIGSLVWRPDGTELLFDSDHSFGMSYYGRDLYAITADSGYLRKITNPPEPRYLEAYPKGGVKFSSQNWLGKGSNFWAYVEGSRTNVTWLSASTQTWTLTFADIADFGDGIRQYAVVGYMGYNRRRMCRYDLAGMADIVPGETVEIAQDFNAWGHMFQHCVMALEPSWSGDGEKILFTVVSGMDQYSDGISRSDYENYDIRISDSENLPPGNRGVRVGMFERSYSSDPKRIKLSSTEEENILLVIHNFHADRIYISSTSDPDIDSPDRLQRIDLGFCNYGDDPGYWVDRCHISDIEWLPDGSGFLVSMHVGTGNRFDQQKRHFDRIYRHDLGTGSTDMLVSLEGEYIGNITVSPDGGKIAFERGSRNEGPHDIWIYDIENENLNLLVKDGAAPAW